MKYGSPRAVRSYGLLSRESLWGTNLPVGRPCRPLAIHTAVADLFTLGTQQEWTLTGARLGATVGTRDRIGGELGSPGIICDGVGQLHGGLDALGVRTQGDDRVHKDEVLCFVPVDDGRDLELHSLSRAGRASDCAE